MTSKKDVMESHGIKDHYNWVPDFVYGGIDGAVTTFAVVAGVEGASLSLPIILVLGFANLFADGFSMAVGKYQSDKSEQELFDKIKRTEYEHLKSKPEHEREEIVEIMEGYGFKGKDLERAVEIICSNDDVWVDLMMRNEFNMTEEGVEPLKGGVITFVSFVTIGFIPLLGYVFGIGGENAFAVTIGMTLFALFIVGTVKARFSVRHWFLSGLETASIGGVAAGIAYYVGYLLRGLMV
ncbi:VIT1/CCC1 transporter family protein [Candidatus Gracilibacteria bacterium]|nr:VIT1/CCC1 transporter family protein [Candidatus Gracilibacteria bacterium]